MSCRPPRAARRRRALTALGRALGVDWSLPPSAPRNCFIISFTFPALILFIFSVRARPCVEDAQACQGRAIDTLAGARRRRRPRSLIERPIVRRGGLPVRRAGDRSSRQGTRQPTRGAIKSVSGGTSCSYSRVTTWSALGRHFTHRPRRSPPGNVVRAGRSARCPTQAGAPIQSRLRQLVLALVHRPARPVHQTRGRTFAGTTWSRRSRRGQHPCKSDNLRAALEVAPGRLAGSDRIRSPGASGA